MLKLSAVGLLTNLLEGQHKSFLLYFDRIHACASDDEVRVGLAHMVPHFGGLSTQMDDWSGMGPKESVIR